MPKPDLKVLDGGRPSVVAPAARSSRSGAPRAKTLAQAIATDDEVAGLKALRSVLARRIQDPKTSAVAVAALTKQFRELGEQIAAASGGGRETEGSSAGESFPDEQWDPDEL